jgi:hypothetical protein
MPLAGSGWIGARAARSRYLLSRETHAKPGRNSGKNFSSTASPRTARTWVESAPPRETSNNSRVFAKIQNAATSLDSYPLAGARRAHMLCRSCALFWLRLCRVKSATLSTAKRLVPGIAWSSDRKFHSSTNLHVEHPVAVSCSEIRSAKINYSPIFFPSSFKASCRSSQPHGPPTMPSTNFFVMPTFARPVAT